MHLETPSVLDKYANIGIKTLHTHTSLPHIHAEPNRHITQVSSIIENTGMGQSKYDFILILVIWAEF